MNAEESIRLHFPFSLARLYEVARLESEPRLRVIKLIGLFEETVRHLALVGLATCLHRGRVSDQVAEARLPLGRPSLGHWIALLKATAGALDGPEFTLLTPPLEARLKGDSALYAATQQLAASTGTTLPKRVRIQHFLDAMVEFRNKKHGHGSLSSYEARQIVTPLEAGLLEWLGGLSLLSERTLLYIDRVEWQDPHFAYTGTNLNSGTSLYPVSLQGDTAITPRRVYLSPSADLTDLDFIPLHPFFAYDADSHRLYCYSELSGQNKPVLRCAYEPSGSTPPLELDEPASAVLGNGAPPRPAPAIAKPRPRREKKTAVPAATPADYPGMRAWYDIIPPHEDIRKGHFDEAVFAADLGDVASGQAPPDYGDPYLFFKKTYPTRGLQSLLRRVQETLTTGKGSSVIQIQTPFGGGKTHALVAIYHYLKHGQRIKELLPNGLELLSPQVAVVGGNHWDPIAGVTGDGVTRRTFWGEVAYQIGGRQGYEAFRASDEARVSPGKDRLRQFLAAHQPFILLFDEILEYINRALDVREALDVSLGTQTFSFFQELTEAVATIPRGMLVVTLPSSHLEDFSERQEESLARLGKIFGRVESIETPVQGEEVYAVIRRRLFEVEKLRQGPMREIVHRYFQLYQQHRDDLPPKARDVNYRDRMELAYPFHPDVIDILYEKWSTFPSFQRTRGVLRLLANVVEDLYQREAPLDLIVPGDINLGRPGVRQEFLKHIGPEYEGVIGSDIAGHEAKAQAMDAANRPWRHLAQRISTAVFFHSFSAVASEKGVSLPYIKLATMHSSTMPAMVTEVLGRLANTLWYLNSRGDAYYFSRIPNLNRMILDKKELYNQAYEPELRRIVERETGSNFRTYVWPEDGEGIPDNRDLKLVILKPDDAGGQIPEWLERRGASFREYKNTLFFALADSGAFARLREDVKTWLALHDIQAELDRGHSPLPQEKRAEVRDRMRNIERDFSYNVRRMYHTLQVGDRRVDLGQPVAGRESLGNWYWRELTSSDVGAIATRLHYRLIVNKFMAGNEQLSTAVLLDQFYKNPQLPALSEPGVLARAIQLGVEEAAFGLIETLDGELLPESLRYKVNVPLDAISFQPGVVLLSRQQSEALLAQLAKEEEGEEAAERGEIAVIESGEGPGPGADKEKEGRPPEPERYHKVRLVIAGVPAGRIADVNRGILLPFSQAVGNFTFTLTIDVESEEGITRATLENRIKETVRQIGARLVGEHLE